MNHDGDTPTGDSPSRGQNGRFTRSADTAERDSLAARLRTTGMSYREIARQLDYSDESGAYKAVSRALKAIPAEDVAELRAVECARLDALTQRLWGVLNTKYPVDMATGRQVVDQNDKPIEDPAPLLAVADRLLRISVQRSRLLGLEQQQKPEPPAPPQPAAVELLGRFLAALLPGSEPQALTAASDQSLRALAAVSGPQAVAGGGAVTPDRIARDAVTGLAS